MSALFERGVPEIDRTTHACRTTAESASRMAERTKHTHTSMRACVATSEPPLRIVSRDRRTCVRESVCALCLGVDRALAVYTVVPFVDHFVFCGDEHRLPIVSVTCRFRRTCVCVILWSGGSSSRRRGGIGGNTQPHLWNVCAHNNNYNNNSAMCVCVCV